MWLLLIGGLALLVAAAAWAWTPDRPRWQLEARYLAAPGDLLEVAGLRLHLRDSGPRDAPAVIMLHGFGASLHTWEPWASALEDRFRVIRYDLAGFGLTGPDPAGDYTLDRDLAVLGAVMDRLGLDAAALIGNSMGGKVAWHFAARNPGRVTRLVLISPDGFAQPGQSYGEAPRVGRALGLMRHFLPRSLLRSNLAAAYGDRAALTEPMLTRYHDLMLVPGNREAMIARFRQAVLEDPALLLPRIAVPVLLLWGDRDRLIPVSNAEDYLRLLPDARLVRFPELGHLPHEEAPENSLPPVAAFLAG